LLEVQICHETEGDCGGDKHHRVYQMRREGLGGFLGEICPAEVSGSGYQCNDVPCQQNPAEAYKQAWKDRALGSSCKHCRAHYHPASYEFLGRKISLCWAGWPDGGIIPFLTVMAALQEPADSSSHLPGLILLYNIGFVVSNKKSRLVSRRGDWV